MTDPPVFAAADLGAASGRVVVGAVMDGAVRLEEVHRFPNLPVTKGGTLQWDIFALYRSVLEGIRRVARTQTIVSIGVDSWAVDYGLLDAGGQLLGNPVHYRDRRTDGIMERVLTQVPAPELYARTGIQFLPINTIYQLAAAAGTAQLETARTLLLIPDLMVYWLTGEVGAERTNASTTQLLDARTGEWAQDIVRRIGVDPGLLPPLRTAGTTAGVLLPDTMQVVGLRTAVPVVSVCSHDTASAVVAVPAGEVLFAYISCGTWSLVGVELDAPILTEESRAANFTNEIGADGTVRYLRNVMGLWLLQECLRTWGVHDRADHVEALMSAAARAEPLAVVIDPDLVEFLPPGDMPARIANVCRRTGQPVPVDRAATVRCILDSLALAFRAAILDAERLSGREVEVVHIVGGGARNAFLCQLTADACGLPVVAGPVEATALGNVLIQARAAGAIRGGLRELRAHVPASEVLGRYEPRGDRAAWQAAAERAGLSGA